MMCEIQWQIRSIIEPMASLDNNFRGLCMHGINDITWLCKDITKTTRIMHLCFLSDDIFDVSCHVGLHNIGKLLCMHGVFSVSEIKLTFQPWTNLILDSIEGDVRNG